jgi:hypothetical protein
MGRIALLMLTATVAFGQDHQTMVNQHGDHVMGFSHEKTSHHFELKADGGLIEVRTNDERDSESRDQIRMHFRHIVQMFADGNFNAPMLVHGVAAPGTAAMTRLKTEIRWTLEETPRGARIVIATSNHEALDAVHEFLKFQIEDHKTGDSTAVRE